MNSDTMNSNKMISDTQMQIKTYRYKFSDEISDEISYFATMHKYDNQKTFKEEWAKWIQPNNSKIELEIKRLTDLGAEGDIMDKLYKSARYYYRKKPMTPPPVKSRKDYTRFSETMLSIMDANIHEQLNNAKANEKDNQIDVSPAEAYHLFCKTNTEHISREVQSQNSKNPQTWIELSNKFKKTYKNRYYNICNKYK